LIYISNIVSGVEVPDMIVTLIPADIRADMANVGY